MDQIQVENRPEETRQHRENREVLVRLKEIYKSYKAGDKAVQVLKGINLEVQAGEFVAVVGASGNGKSTLLNMITGIDNPDSGEVIINGRPIHKLSEDDLAAWRSTQVGIVFQFFQLLPSLSLLQNLILPMEFAGRGTSKERRQRAEHLLGKVGLANEINKLPSQISGGQQQRAAIARALANDPPLLVADEPTGNLDGRTAQDIFSLFIQLVEQGKTLIIVTHNEDLACQVPRRVEVMNGIIQRDGKCQDQAVLPV
jgi:putative ABC transport system ATP-binding protein